MSIHIENFGCRLNALEGDSARAQATAAGLTQATIINGCAVTNEAVRQARQAARRAKRARPDDKIIVTGCAGQIDAGRFAAMPEVDLVLGNEEKLQAAAYQQTGVKAANIMARRVATRLPVAQQELRARAFVQVQTGCDHRCTFCIIPFGRGNARSVPIEQVVRRVRDLVDAGHQEVVLTGVDVTSYGADIGEAGLGALMCAILRRVPDLPRLRLSSIDASEIDPTLFDLVIHEPRVMPHLHLSLQAGDDLILKRMKRRHTRAQAVAFCARLKAQRPDLVLGADLIAGFPTETRAMFDNSLSLISDCDLVWLHVFPFSPRPDTPAARMPQVSGDVIRARAGELRAAGTRQRDAWLDSQIGRDLSVLVEKSGEGRADNFARVKLSPHLASGTIHNVRVSGRDGVWLLATDKEGEQ